MQSKDHLTRESVSICALRNIEEVPAIPFRNVECVELSPQVILQQTATSCWRHIHWLEWYIDEPQDRHWRKEMGDSYFLFLG